MITIKMFMFGLNTGVLNNTKQYSLIIIIINVVINAVIL